MSQSKAREFWIVEPRGAQDSDFHSATSYDPFEANSQIEAVHVIEHSAYLEAIARAEAAERNAKLAAEVDSDSCETIAALQEQLAAVTAKYDALVTKYEALAEKYIAVTSLISELVTINDYEFPYRVPELIERANKLRKDIK